MDSSFINEQADRCHRLAENADPFIKKRLLDLAAHYDNSLDGRSRASRTIAIPTSLLESRLQESRS
jgi:hypothetical protein